MGLGVTAKETSLGELFAPGEQIAMPPYQRSYSWTEHEAGCLLDDLLNATSEGTPHFVGAIVTVQPDAGGAAQIVDGQQRLTTLTILLCCLRDLERDPALKDACQSLITDTARPNLREEARWRLSLNHIDNPFFRVALQKPGATLAKMDDNELSQSQKRIWRNAKLFLKKLRPLGVDERRALYRTVSERCAMVKVRVDDWAAGFGVFRVLNTRGKEPNAHDIIKTDLFERAGFSMREADAQSRRWSEHEAELGGDPFDDLLRQIRIIYDRSSKGDLMTGFRKSVLSKMSPREFLDDLLPAYVTAFSEISKGRIDMGAHSEPINEHLNRLLVLDHIAWRAPALKFLVAHRERPGSAGDPVEFFANLERLGFALQLIINDRDQRARRYRRVMDTIDAKRSLFGNSSPFVLTKDECRRIRERLRGRFAAFGQRRALALRLNASLAGGTTLSPDADATVEHVLPRNPAPDSYWMTVWPNAQTRNDLCDTIGNFVLLPQALNQKADRMTYHEKVQVYFDDDNGGAEFALTQDLRSEPSWTAETVRRRTDRLADILCRDWGII